MNTEQVMAYLAGAFDGDGSFSLLKGSSRTSISPLYYPMIQLANINKVLIDFIRDNFGGLVSIRAPYKGSNGLDRKLCYGWKLEKSIKCLPALEKLIPYLIIKKERAIYLRDYILDNPFKRGCGPLSKDVLIKREKAYLKMRSFNDIPDVHGDLLSKSKRRTAECSIFWAYVAGIMDTDGSFTLKREMKKGRLNPTYTSMVSLSMVDCRAVYYIANNFVGAQVYTVKASSTTNGFCYRLSVNGFNETIEFLIRVIPFLLIKKEVAEELLFFCRNRKTQNGRKGISKEEYSFRETVYEKIRHLNKYGVVKSPLMDLEFLPDNAEDNKAQAAKACSVNVASEETSVKEDAVL